MSSNRNISLISNSNISMISNDTTSQQLFETFPRKIFFILFPCMVTTGVVCNTLIFVIMRRRRMSHLSTCYYMGILAIADSSVLLLGLTVLWFYLVDRRWSLLLQSTYACKILSVLFYTVSDVSVWLVCMMSADRCIAVTRPLHASSICTVRRARICVIILVFCIILINIHFLFTHHLSNENDCIFHERYEVFILRIWPWIDAAVYSALPFILLLTINLIIVQSLFQAKRSTPYLQIHQSFISRHKNKSSVSMSRKLTTMLLAVTVFFLLSSFPMVCLQIYSNIHNQNQNRPTFSQLYLKPLCETLQYSNHCVNFFLYAITGKAFRHELKRLFCTIAVKMHLTKDPAQKSIDRCTIGKKTYNISNRIIHEQKIQQQRILPCDRELIQCEQLHDPAINSDNVKPRYLCQKQDVIRNKLPDTAYYLQKVSNV